jgi:hypothetical protein
MSPEDMSTREMNGRACDKPKFYAMGGLIFRQTMAGSSPAH